MRDVPLTVLKGGINRLRTKGGARADNLYDLVNGYVTESGTARCRPGSLRLAQLLGTKGLCSFSGSLHVFSHQVVFVPEGFTLHILTHPEQDAGEPLIALSKIHFAKPFLGYLYVAAEFEDGTICHYWLQEGTTWAPNKVYFEGDLVQPEVPTGIAYQATRLGAPNPVWAANTPRAIGDVVEPTEYNGYYYTVIDTSGATPSSGETEPNWPTAAGATITESTDITPDTTTSTATDSSQTISSDITDRYDF